MNIEQIYTGCIAEAAYYINSEKEAVIIDPLRETAPYIERAGKDGVTIKYIFLTHFHADFVSGHVDLANKTGATIILGPTAEAAYEFHQAKDNEVFKVGNVSFKWIHTPGHTRESSCILLSDESGKETALFTGDTLFIGDVGRPDLAVKQGELTEEDLAKMLYHSLREKVMVLPEDIIVYPAHGAGSACGKNMSKETFDTLANQKKNNYALQDMSESEFVEKVLDGLSAPPQYFPLNVKMNKGINREIDEIIQTGTKALDVDAFKAHAEGGALMLDVRTQFDFVAGHIPNSIFIGLNGGFAPWVGALIKDIHQPIILIAPEGQEEEAVTRLSRIGYDNSIGYLKGGIDAWVKSGNEIAKIDTIEAKALENKLKKQNLEVLDVRKDGEFNADHLDIAKHFSLDRINEEFEDLDKDKTYYVHCAGGYRSVIFESILKSRGYHNLVDVLGGYKAIKDTTNLSCSETACSSAS
jgi:hydroxyacylglutathione hydrolase